MQFSNIASLLVVSVGTIQTFQDNLTGMVKLVENLTKRMTIEHDDHSFSQPHLQLMVETIKKIL